MQKLALSLFLLFYPSLLFCGQSFEELMEALEVATYWDQKLYERFPVSFNHLLSTGYFNTHSARMTDEGAVGFGIALAPPYLNWNARVQPFNHLEFSANYRVFTGYKDPNLSPYGFGDYADRGANFKWALMTPEESLFLYPGIALGVDDFMGSKKFTTYYIVGTQVLREQGLEVSLGWGTGLYTKGPSRGFFGGFNWHPFWNHSIQGLRGWCLTTEWDPINYKKDPHPLGKSSHLPLNLGSKYLWKDFLEVSASYIRGERWAGAASLHYNWGKCEGLVPKIKDPHLYSAPLNRDPLGCFRSECALIEDMKGAFENQGFKIIKAWIAHRGEKKQLSISLINCRYRHEHIVKLRLYHLLLALTPSNITEVIVMIESYGLPCQQYHFTEELLNPFRPLTLFELEILTPKREVNAPYIFCAPPLFEQHKELFHWGIGPRYESFLGSAYGKYKYDLGLKSVLEGFLPFDCFYEIQASYTALSSLHCVADFDFFHPSQLPNVASDYIRYRQSGGFSWDRLFVQKSVNLGKGFFCRGSLGYFQVNYGGIAGEVLWYPAHAHFAWGVEGAVVKKRGYTGLGFQSKLRKFKEDKPYFFPYSNLQQYFLNFYLDLPEYSLFTKCSLGQFLAYDKGIKIELTRYFDNGLRLTGWLTFTDAYDVIHGEKYYDRGIALEVPFDFFYRCSSRRVWNYATAAWLRDAGYATSTGKSLFEIVNRERRW